METVTYHKEITALLVIDPHNDFISEGGKVWIRLKAVAGSSPAEAAAAADRYMEEVFQVPPR